MPSKGYRKQYCPKSHDTFKVGRTIRGRCRKCTNEDITIYGNARYFQILWSLKCNPCYDCKQWFNPWVMQFDHLPTFSKTKSLNRCYSLKKLFPEMRKCQLVCANCHWDRTHARKFRHTLEELYV